MFVLRETNCSKLKINWGNTGTKGGIKEAKKMTKKNVQKNRDSTRGGSVKIKVNCLE